MHVLFFAKFCIRQATHWTTQDKGKRDQKRANYPTNEIKAVIWFLLLLHNDRAVWLEALNMDFLQTWLFQFDDSDMTAFQSRWIYVSIVVLYSLGAGKQTRAHTHTTTNSCWNQHQTKQHLWMLQPGKDYHADKLKIVVEVLRFTWQCCTTGPTDRQGKRGLLQWCCKVCPKRTGMCQPNVFPSKYQYGVILNKFPNLSLNQTWIFFVDACRTLDSSWATGCNPGQAKSNQCLGFVVQLIPIIRFIISISVISCSLNVWGTFSWWIIVEQISCSEWPSYSHWPTQSCRSLPLRLAGPARSHREGGYWWRTFEKKQEGR